jgi:hypothetical protein
MPADRSKKALERKALAKRIESLGVEMSPCSNCERHARKCVVSSHDSSRCSECVWHGIKCDVEGIPVRDWETLEREEERIRSARQAAVELMAVTSARLARLEKQQEFLRRRGRDMLRRGFRTLDELEAVEEKERQDEKAKQVEPTTTSSVEEFPELDIYGGLSPSFWQGLDVVGGMSSIAPGS